MKHNIRLTLCFTSTLYFAHLFNYLLMALIDIWLFKENATKEELIDNTKRLHLSYTPEKVPRYR